MEFTINDEDEFPPVVEFGIAKNPTLLFIKLYYSKITLFIKLSTSFVSVTFDDRIFQPIKSESTTQTCCVVSSGHSVLLEDHHMISHLRYITL